MKKIVLSVLVSLALLSGSAAFAGKAGQVGANKGKDAAKATADQAAKNAYQAYQTACVAGTGGDCNTAKENLKTRTNKAQALSNGTGAKTK